MYWSHRTPEDRCVMWEERRERDVRARCSRYQWGGRVSRCSNQSVCHDAALMLSAGRRAAVAMWPTTSTSPRRLDPLCIDRRPTDIDRAAAPSRSPKLHREWLISGAAAAATACVRTMDGRDGRKCRRRGVDCLICRDTVDDSLGPSCPQARLRFIDSCRQCLSRNWKIADDLNNQDHLLRARRLDVSLLCVTAHWLPTRRRKIYFRPSFLYVTAVDCVLACENFQ